MFESLPVLFVLVFRHSCGLWLWHSLDVSIHFFGTVTFERKMCVFQATMENNTLISRVLKINKAVKRDKLSVNTAKRVVFTETQNTLFRVFRQSFVRASIHHSEANTPLLGTWANLSKNNNNNKKQKQKKKNK